MLSHVLLFATPWTAAHQAPLSMGFCRQEYWNRLPFSSPEDLPDPGIEPGSPAWQVDSLSSEPPAKPGNIQIFPSDHKRCPSYMGILPLKKRSHCLGFTCSISPSSYNWPNGAPFYRLENRGAKQLGTLTTRAHRYKRQRHDGSFTRLMQTVEITLCARCCDRSMQTSVGMGILVERTARKRPPK